MIQSEQTRMHLDYRLLYRSCRYLSDSQGLDSSTTILQALWTLHWIQIPLVLLWIVLGVTVVTAVALVLESGWGVCLHIGHGDVVAGVIKSIAPLMFDSRLERCI